MRLTWKPGLAALSMLFAGSAASGNPPGEALRVAVRTDQGAFEAELYPALAPETVRLFLARATGEPEVAPYAGSQVCEVRGSAYVVFGCAPFENRGPKPTGARKGPRQPVEIDARAMGLDRQPIGSARENHDLWQFEIVPRYAALRDRGKPVPAGLQSLIDQAETRGTAAIETTAGRSRLWYLEAVGFSFTPGASSLRVTRGALATFAMWPDDADERFFVALDDMPARDGRATVFGRVVAGWDTLDRIQRIPVDKARRPELPVHITGIETLGGDRGTARDNGVSARGGDRRHSEDS